MCSIITINVVIVSNDFICLLDWLYSHFVYVLLCLIQDWDFTVKKTILLDYTVKTINNCKILSKCKKIFKKTSFMITLVLVYVINTFMW